MKKNQDIALVGAHVRVPGAKNTKEFFNNLIQAKVSISSFADKLSDNSEC